MRNISIFILAFILSCQSFSKNLPENLIKLEINKKKELRFIIKNTPSIECIKNIDEDSAKISTDGHYLIIDYNKYIETKSITDCNIENIQVKNTPLENGELFDINQARKLALSLVFVKSGPTKYLAFLTRIGEKKNLISFPGSYSGKANIKLLQRYSFSFITSPKISPDGLHIDISGDSDCSGNSYPGVWNISTKKKIVFQGTPNEIKKLCENLFN